MTLVKQNPMNYPLNLIIARILNFCYVKKRKESESNKTKDNAPHKRKERRENNGSKKQLSCFLCIDYLVMANYMLIKFRK